MSPVKRLPWSGPIVAAAVKGKSLAPWRAEITANAQGSHPPGGNPLTEGEGMSGPMPHSAGRKRLRDLARRAKGMSLLLGDPAMGSADRQTSPPRDPWLSGPVGETRGIGLDYFQRLAAEAGFELRKNGTSLGLIADVDLLAAADFEPDRVDPNPFRQSYESTSAYELDAWSKWCGRFRPFGRLLALIFSRRLQQLNVPLSSQDTSKGITSEIFQVLDTATKEVLYTAWLRRLLATGNACTSARTPCAPSPTGRAPASKWSFPSQTGTPW